MGEVIITMPSFSRLRLDIPWALVKLAEQIRPNCNETMILSVTGTKGNVFDVNMKRTEKESDERFLIDIADQTGETGVIEAEDDGWVLALGAVQSPVYLQKDHEAQAKTEPPDPRDGGDDQPDSLAAPDHGDPDGALDVIASLATSHDPRTPSSGQDVQVKNERTSADNGQVDGSSGDVTLEAAPDGLPEPEEEEAESLESKGANAGSEGRSFQEQFEQSLQHQDPPDSALPRGEEDEEEAQGDLQNIQYVLEDADGRQTIIQQGDGQQTIIHEVDAHERTLLRQDGQAIIQADGETIIEDAEGEVVLGRDEPIQLVMADGQQLRYDAKEGSAVAPDGTTYHIQLQGRSHQQQVPTHHHLTLESGETLVEADADEAGQPLTTVVAMKPEVDAAGAETTTSYVIDAQEVEMEHSGIPLEDGTLLVSQLSKIASELESKVIVATSEDGTVIEIQSSSAWPDCQDVNDPDYIPELQVAAPVRKARTLLRHTADSLKGITSNELELQHSLQINSDKDIPRIIMDVQAYQCYLCPNTYSQLQVLYNHLQRKHKEAYFDNTAIKMVTIKDAFLCYICHKPSRRFDALKKHLQSIHKMNLENKRIVKISSCPLCYSKYANLRTLRCHLNYKHKDHPNFNKSLVMVQEQIFREPKRRQIITLNCPRCEKEFDALQLRHHIKLTHRDDPQVEQLLKDVKATSKRKQKENLRTKHKWCYICEKDFRAVEYYAHMYKVHHMQKNQRIFHCEICNKNFGTLWHLKNHALVHSDQRDHKCDLCEAAFKDKWSLRSHTRHVHLKQFPHACKDCGMGFAKVKQLENHLCGLGPTGKPRLKRVGRPRSRPRPRVAARRKVPPDSPGASSWTASPGSHTTAASLLSGMASPASSSASAAVAGPSGEQGAVVKEAAAGEEGAESPHLSFGVTLCSICNKSFPTRPRYLTHLRRVHHISKSGMKEFKCDLCGKTFILKSRLTEHMVIHSGEKNFECGECHKKFYFSWHLKRHHQLVHLGIYPVVCPECGAGFEKKRQLAAHTCGEDKTRRKVKVKTETPESVPKKKRGRPIKTALATATVVRLVQMQATGEELAAVDVTVDHVNEEGVTADHVTEEGVTADHVTEDVTAADLTEEVAGGGEEGEGALSGAGDAAAAAAEGSPRPSAVVRPPTESRTSGSKSPELPHKVDDATPKSDAIAPNIDSDIPLIAKASVAGEGSPRAPPGVSKTQSGMENGMGKAKAGVTGDATPGQTPKRPRGRPPKNAAAKPSPGKTVTKATVGGSKESVSKVRGQFRVTLKGNQKLNEDNTPKVKPLKKETVEESAAAATTPKGRGRPAAKSSPPPTATSKGRGRPAGESPATATPRGRGRPRSLPRTEDTPKVKAKTQTSPTESEAKKIILIKEEPSTTSRSRRSIQRPSWLKEFDD